MLRDLILRLVPRDTAQRMEAESRLWRMRCAEGHERSVWDAGGLRWGASGRPKRYVRCPDCRSWRWHDVFRAREPRT